MKIADHIFVYRFLYSHHGIYYSKNKVIHFTGEPLSGQPAVIRIDHIDDFAKGDKIELVSYTKCFPPKETIYRAEVCLGESDYSLISNNCEHFCKWCKTGMHISDQVESKKHPGAPIDIFAAPIAIYATIKECKKIIFREKKLRLEMRNVTKQLILNEIEKSKAFEKHLAKIKMELLYKIALAKDIIKNSKTANLKFHKERLKINKALIKYSEELLNLLNTNEIKPDSDSKNSENVLFLLRQIRFLLEL